MEQNSNKRQNYNFSEADKQANILKFLEEQKLITEDGIVPKTDELGNFLYFEVVNATWDTSINGMHIFPSSDVIKREYVKSKTFELLDTKYFEGKQYGFTDLIRLIWSRNKDEAKVMATQLIQTDYKSYEIPEEPKTDDSNDPEYVKTSKGKTSILENKYLEHFQGKHPDYRFFNGDFYSKNGKEDRSAIKKEIQADILQYVDKGLAGMTDSLYRALSNNLYTEAQRPKQYEIHTLNKSLRINMDNTSEPYIEEINNPEIILNMLQVNYGSDKKPTLWLKFLAELLCPEDILTLQEYLGYLLIPSNKGQKALFILGRGGEGKSRITVVLKNIFKGLVVLGKLQKIENSSFYKSQLEGRYAYVDDDLDTAALKSTGDFKELVTLETETLVEKKGIDAFETYLYARFFCLTNKAITACHDRSEGFYRRLLLLRCLPIAPDREADPYLDEKLATEIDAIFMWMVEGLLRLIKQKFRFTISEASKQELSDLINENNSISGFLKDESYIIPSESSTVKLKDLYDVYSNWCQENNIDKPLARNTFNSFLKENSNSLNIKYSENCKDAQGNRYRGYTGLKLLRPLDNYLPW